MSLFCTKLDASVHFFKFSFYTGIQLINSVVFQVYSKVIQLYIYKYLFFFNFFSYLGYYRILSSIPCALQQVPVCRVHLYTPRSLVPHSLKISTNLGTSLAVQWLRLCASSARGWGWVRSLVGELRSYMLHGVAKKINIRV